MFSDILPTEQSSGVISGGSMKGNIISWKDEKGFGFIKNDENGEHIFFHISSVIKGTRQPIVGDAVTFDVGVDSSNRKKAKDIFIEGVSFTNIPRRVFTEKVKRDRFDYYCYVAIVLSVAITLAVYIKMGQPRLALFPAAVAIMLFLYISVRTKKPANDIFSCGKCSSVVRHDARTIRAWNKGACKLYYRTCNQNWHREKPQRDSTKKYNRPQKSGCLGVLLFITFVPVFLISSIITLLV